jgi:hypothetical protein
MAAEGRATSETRKIAAILVADVVGYSRLAGAPPTRSGFWRASGRSAAILSRSDHRHPPRARRRERHRVSQRGRCGALRDRSPERHGRAQRLDEARRELKSDLAVNPKFTIKRFRAAAQSDNAVYLAQRERIIEGMRLAGVPEG